MGLIYDTVTASNIAGYFNTSQSVSYTHLTLPTT